LGGKDRGCNAAQTLGRFSGTATLTFCALDKAEVDSLVTIREGRFAELSTMPLRWRPLGRCAASWITSGMVSGGEPSSGNTADPQLIMLRFWSDANQLFRYASGGEMSRLDTRTATEVTTLSGRGGLPQCLACEWGHSNGYRNCWESDQRKRRIRRHQARGTVARLEAGDRCCLSAAASVPFCDR
jgi:hypothetical protein